MLCKHDHTKRTEVGPYWDRVPLGQQRYENPATEAWLTAEELCLDCGCRRLIDVSLRHTECGQWRFPERPVN